MARNRRNSSFTAIRIEGGILPPEFLNVVAAQEAKHQTGADYGLTKSLTLKDELARYWRIANDLYTAYAERRERTDLSPIKVGVDDWLVSLLKEVLGFRDVAPARSVAVGDRTFTITHQAFGAAVPALLTTREFELDRADPRFGEDGRRRAPHGLMQELLNASDDALWGIVANGAKLRLIRDNPSLTRPAYIEADLDLIFSEQLYPDFVALWLLGHATRLKPVNGKASGTILERWRAEAHETGERALEHLRDGVTEALRQLGNGFLQHPHNEGLRAALSDGTLSAERYFQELLRLVYRLLFLFTAEERGLLHSPYASDDQRAIYAQGYSLARLRDRALKRRHYDRHHDLWQGLKLVFNILSRGEPALGLPALGGLFTTEQCRNLEAGLIRNERLLEAVRALAYFRSGSALARVNYRDMGTEELGSVYESLLELHPVIDVDAAPWTFGFVGEANGEKTKGSERKLTGSYYTPAALVNELIKSALEPIMSKAVQSTPGDSRGALLGLKIVDPACGSGHFLLAAARRVAAEIARIEAGSDTPDEAARQHALREVVQHCIYGVDRNPLAVELCRTALWIETVEPGKPLTFLDSHIRCGDSLVGVFDLSVLRDGIPDAAYKPLTGDDREVANHDKAKNRREQKERERIESGFGFNRQRDLARDLAALAEMPEDTVEQIAEKHQLFERLTDKGAAAWTLERACDLWTAAWFAPKTRGGQFAGPDGLPRRGAETVPTSGQVWEVLRGRQVCGPLIGAAAGLAERHRFFHWPPAFADVMAQGGFDVVIGNPPWERIKLSEQEFFASRSPEITKAPNKTARERLIKALGRSDASSAEKTLLGAFEDAKREAEAASQFVRTGGRYPLTGTGDSNTYALFAELASCLVGLKGNVGIVVPAGLMTDSKTKDFFVSLFVQRKIDSFYCFDNALAIFPAIHRDTPFGLLTLRSSNGLLEFCVEAKSIEEARDQRRRFKLTTNDLDLLNCNTRTAPTFRAEADAETAKRIYRNIPPFIRETEGNKRNEWGARLFRMFDSAQDSGLFREKETLEESGYVRRGLYWITDSSQPSGLMYAPFYEGKMIGQFDHRAGTFHGCKSRPPRGASIPEPEVSDKHRSGFEVEPWYWVACPEIKQRFTEANWSKGWSFGYRFGANPTNSRTVICSVIPFAAVPHVFPQVLVDDRITRDRVCGLLANLNSLVVDYICRLKMSRQGLDAYIVKQLPILPPAFYTEPRLKFIVSKVLELTYTSHSLAPFARDLGHEGPPFAWDEDRRALLRADLDAFYARAYGLTRDELRYLLDPADVKGPDYPSETFRVLKEKEIRQYGEYRTRRLVLAAWDRMEAEGEFANLGLVPSTAAAPQIVTLPTPSHQPQPVPDMALAADGAWARPMTNPRGEIMEVLLAALQAMDGSRPPERVRLAAILAMEPHRLLPHLDTERAREWRRVVGDEANGSFQDSAELDEHWGAAIRHFRSRGWLEDMSGTWGPGALPTDFQAGEWALGRAAVAWDAMRRIGEKAEVISLFSEQLDRWRNAEAA